MNGIHEVTGSIPVWSTTPSPSVVVSRPCSVARGRYASASGIESRIEGRLGFSLTIERLRSHSET